jgi:hypothetical protein
MLKLRHHYRTMKNVGIYRYSVYIKVLFWVVISIPQESEVIAMVFLHYEAMEHMLNNEECWYLPLFGVYHPKKPDQIRGVFDSSAKFNGMNSLFPVVW